MIFGNCCEIIQVCKWASNLPDTTLMTANNGSLWILKLAHKIYRIGEDAMLHHTG